MNNDKAIWCYSTDEEYFHDHTNAEVTRDEAIAEAIDELGLEDGDSFYLGKQRTIDAAEYLDAERILEEVSDRIYDEAGEISEGWPDVSAEDVADLSNRLMDAF
jgi:hypothetical protein